jgi:thiol-disulfide isomerase/thioredoxin
MKTQSERRTALAPGRRRLAAAAGAALVCWHGRAALAQSAPQSAEAGRARQPLPAVGSVLRLPEATLLDGGKFRPADADGRVLVLYWWASWCPFCAQQSPHMQALWEKARPRGMRMLALSIDRRAEDARGYLEKKGYTFPAALVTPEINQLLPKPYGLPVTMVRGPDGRVLQAESGQIFPEDVEALIRWLT